MNAAFHLTIEGVPALAVRSFEAFERLHIEGAARALVADGDLDPEEILGTRATLEIAAEGTMRAEARRFHGVVDAVEASLGGVAITIVPRVIPLLDGLDHRVFLERDSVSIAEELLGEAGLALDVRVGARPRPRRQCVQGFESVLAFVRRILGEDGVSLWVEHGASEDVVVLAEGGDAWPDLPGGAVLRFRPTEGLRGEEAVTDISLVHSLTHDGAAVTDYDPDHPTVDLAGSVGEGRFPLFVYPGRHRSPEEGKARARLLLEAARSGAVRLHARTTCRHVAVGFIVEITDAPRDDQNGRFRVIEVRHRGQDFAAGGEGDLRYEAELVAVPADLPVRPSSTAGDASMIGNASITGDASMAGDASGRTGPGASYPRERPKGSGGLTTMTVTGPRGGEIHTDAQGRIKARFRWDRRSAEDDTASAWLRPAQPPLSGGFFLPRTGWEVLVGFMGERAATGDTPIELGRLMNGTAPPAEPLPAQKVRSSWGTLSTPGGGKQNQIRFDDAAGAEGMHVGAAKDYNERTENDKVVTVTADETNIVGRDHVNTVTLQQESTIKGSQTYLVSGNRDMTTVGALGISAASEAVSVGAVRKFQVGGDFESTAASVARIVGAAENVVAIVEANRHVTGASTVTVGGTWAEVGGVSASVGVLGRSTLSVAGPLSVRASTASINASVLTETYAGAYRGHAGGKLTLSAPSIKLKAGGAFKAKGADVFFKATTSIVVKAGGVTITLKPGSIKVKGKLKGDGTSVVTGKEEVG